MLAGMGVGVILVVALVFQPVQKRESGEGHRRGQAVIEK